MLRAWSEQACSTSSPGAGLPGARAQPAVHSLVDQTCMHFVCRHCKCGVLIRLTLSGRFTSGGVCRMDFQGWVTNIFSGQGRREFGLIKKSTASGGLGR